MEQQINIEVIRRYLLGELSETERQRVEDEYLADDDYFEQMLGAENDLIDAFARGTLSLRERERFQSHYLNSAERGERVAFAVQLANHLTAQVDAEEAPPQKFRPASSFWTNFFNLNPLAARIAFALAALVMLTGGIWLVGEMRRLRGDLARSEAEKMQSLERERVLSEQLTAERTRGGEAAQSLEVERKTREILEQELAAERKTTTGPAASGSESHLASFLLVPGAVRDIAGARQLNVPVNTRRVEFRLNFEEGGYGRYSASLQTPEGKEISRQNNLRARRSRTGQTVVFKVPAQRLSSGDYLITLRGANPDGSPADVSEYAFRLVKK